MKKLIFGIIFLLMSNAFYLRQFEVSFAKELGKQSVSEGEPPINLAKFQK